MVLSPQKWSTFSPCLAYSEKTLWYISLVTLPSSFVGAAYFSLETCSLYLQYAYTDKRRRCSMKRTSCFPSIHIRVSVSREFPMPASGYRHANMQCYQDGEAYEYLMASINSFSHQGFRSVQYIYTLSILRSVSHYTYFELSLSLMKEDNLLNSYYCINSKFVNGSALAKQQVIFFSEINSNWYWFSFRHLHMNTWT